MKSAVFAFQAVPDAPSASSSAPAAQSGAEAPQASPPDGLGLLPFLIIVPLMLVLFFQSRSQHKKQEAAIAGLKKGDRVLTQSGLVGRLRSIDARYAEIELPPSGTRVTVLRSGLMGRDAEGETPDKK